MPRVELYTDGAAKGNPGPGGYGAILRHGSNEKELSGGFYHTTNNRMELLAVIVGLEALKVSGCEVTVVSGQQIRCRCLSEEVDWRMETARVGKSQKPRPVEAAIARHGTSPGTVHMDQGPQRQS